MLEAPDLAWNLPSNLGGPVEGVWQQQPLPTQPPRVLPERSWLFLSLSPCGLLWCPDLEVPRVAGEVSGAFAFCPLFIVADGSKLPLGRRLY